VIAVVLAQQWKVKTSESVSRHLSIRRGTPTNLEDQDYAMRLEYALLLDLLCGVTDRFPVVPFGPENFSPRHEAQP